MAEHARVRMSLREVQAYLRLGLLDRGQLPALACDLLESGLVSESVVILAGLSRNDNSGEALELFRRALREGGLPDLSEKEAGWIVARHLAGQIKSGVLPPYEVARRIWWDVWNRIGHPKELTIFVALADEYEELRPRDRDAKAPRLEEEIREAAGRLLDSEKLGQQTDDGPAPRNVG